MNFLKENQLDAYWSIRKFQKEIRKLKSQIKWPRTDVEAKINFLKNIRAQTGCEICEEDDIRVLDFHHIEKKAFDLMRAPAHSWLEILNELNKCEIVCSNCHRKQTFPSLKYS